MGVDLRVRGRELRAAALEVHRALIEVERVAHEREHGRVERPADLLGLVMNDARFAWLRPLSTLILGLDRMLALAEVTQDDAAALRAESEALLASAGQPFRDRYLAALQHPEVVIAHARWRRAVAALPPPAR